MSKIKPFSSMRSNTKQQLPTIKARSARPQTLTHNKSYLGQISKQITGNIEYDDMDSFHLNKQQHKLKQILRKMNDDTVKIIADFTPRTRARKVQSHHRTATSILAIKQKQVENNHKIMEQCQVQIQALKIKAQGLVAYGAKQIYDEHIGKMQEIVFAAQEQNKALILENQKRGKTIVSEKRIIQQGEMRKLQTDVYLAQHKASHLRADDARVCQDINQNEKKIKQIAFKWAQAEKYLKQFEKSIKKQSDLKNNQQVYFHSKASLQNMRKKNQFYNQNYQYRYLNLLRQLDTSTNSVKQLQQKIDKSFVAVQATKMAIAKLESQLKALKTIKRQRESHINQFLHKSKQMLKQKSIDEYKQQLQHQKHKDQEESNKVLNQQSKQMLSQIQIKQEQEADSSKLDLDHVLEGIIEGKGITTPKKSQTLNKSQTPKKSDSSRIKINKQSQLKVAAKEHREDVELEYHI